MRPKKTKLNIAASSAFDHVDWDVVIAQYNAELLEEAYNGALDVGMGRAGQYLDFYRTIEAEYLTRQKSVVIPFEQAMGEAALPHIGPFELEFLPDEVQGAQTEIARIAYRAFEGVASRYGFDTPTRTQLTILAEETDAPWLFGRYGFCIAKDPYFKICIPLHLVHRPEELSRTLKHEYAHVIVGSLSDRKAPRWLDEAAAMAAESSFLPQEARDFASAREEWLEPDELSAELRYAETERDRWLAYAQAGLIGLYLAKEFGEVKIGEIARAFATTDFFSTLISRLKGESDDESAIRRALGIPRSRLFQRALDWVRTRP